MFSLSISWLTINTNEALPNLGYRKGILLYISRLCSTFQEFELLYYNLSSARIFFRTELDENDEDEENEDARSYVSFKSSATTNSSMKMWNVILKWVCIYFWKWNCLWFGDTYDFLWISSFYTTRFYLTLFSFNSWLKKSSRFLMARVKSLAIFQNFWRIQRSRTHVQNLDKAMK